MVDAPTISIDEPDGRARRPRAARLRVVFPRELRGHHDLSRLVTSLGRAPGPGTFSVPHATVSRRHAEIRWSTSDHHVVHDLGSRPPALDEPHPPMPREVRATLLEPGAAPRAVRRYALVAGPERTLTVRAEVTIHRFQLGSLAAAPLRRRADRRRRETGRGSTAWSRSARPPAAARRGRR